MAVGQCVERKPIFLAAVVFCLSTAPAFASPLISFPSTALDFGKVPEGKTIIHEIVFTNTGDTVLEVGDVLVPEGCTAAVVSKKFIPPAQSGSILFKFPTAGHPGIFSKEARVFSNDVARSPVTLSLTGEVVAPFLFYPADTVVYADQTKLLQIRPNPEFSGTPPKLLGLNAVKVVRTSMQLSSMDKPGWKVTLMLSAGRGPFPCDGQVELTTNIPEMPVYLWKCVLSERGK